MCYTSRILNLLGNARGSNRPVAVSFAVGPLPLSAADAELGCSSHSRLRAAPARAPPPSAPPLACKVPPTRVFVQVAAAPPPGAAEAAKLGESKLCAQPCPAALERASLACLRARERRTVPGGALRKAVPRDALWKAVSPSGQQLPEDGRPETPGSVLPQSAGLRHSALSHLIQRLASASPKILTL